jgi:hypothetical protein
MRISHRECTKYAIDSPRWQDYNWLSAALGALSEMPAGKTRSRALRDVATPPTSAEETP